jgi:YD repeat-containing protein
MASGRRMIATPRTTTYLYNAWGEQVGTVLDGITNRTDVTYEQFSNEWWKVETSTVIGPSTNSLTITRTQLTGLSNSCRSHTVTLTGTAAILAAHGTGVLPVDGSLTESLVTYDPATGIETETITSSTGPIIVRRSLHGVLLSSETKGETTYNTYDAFARVAQTWRAAVSAATGTTGVSPVASYDYSPSGDLLAAHTYTNSTDYTTESYAYDMLGNRTATTDALGNTIYRTYDHLGHVVAECGATYPIRYTYDTQGHRTSMTTFRTTGGTQFIASAVQAAH